MLDLCPQNNCGAEKLPNSLVHSLTSGESLVDSSLWVFCNKEHHIHSLQVATFHLSLAIAPSACKGTEQLVASLCNPIKRQALALELQRIK